MTILIPIFGIVFGCGIALLAIWTEYRRDRALIEKGLYQPKQVEPPAPPGWGVLVIGAIASGIGVALLISSFVFETGRGTGIPGLVFLFIGIALLIVYLVAKEKRIVPKD